ncbi:MAG: hypothetical protein K2Y37_16955 [Pirellulales bacterium]|nr:hypothetical protein [Pirellulales bacterium]
MHAIRCQTSTLLACWIASGASLAVGQGVVREGFETTGLKWRDPRSAISFRMERQEPSQSQSHGGRWSEMLVVAASGDEPVYVAYPIAAARVIDDLRASVWVKADRPGASLAARVVLPRSNDLRSGAPLSVMVRGAFYDRAGQWQQIWIEGLPALVERQAQMLRAAGNANVDPREAYIDALWLNISGGRGTTTLWTDELEIVGLVRAIVSPRRRDQTVSTQSPDGTAAQPIGRMTPAGELVPAIRRPQEPFVRLSGATLLVAGRPFYPRVIVYQGEPLAFLRDLGFNVVKLAAPPSRELAIEASRAGMWFVSPPPLLDASPRDAADGSPAPPAATLGAEYDRVLVWDLGDQLTAAELDAVRPRIEALREADRELLRPIVCGPTTELRAYSRHADMLFLTRGVLGTSFEMSEYARWLRERPRLARPGTPIWAGVQTEPLAELVEQVNLLSRGRSAPAIQSEQLRLLVFTALTGGARGLVFDSRTRLDSNAPAARLRAMTLELINLELSLIEPWAAGASYVESVVGSDAEVSAAVMQSDRSRMVLPMWNGRGAQFVAGQSAGANLSLTVPATSESFQAFEVTPADLPRPRHKQVAGGTRLILDEFGLTSTILLTTDAVAVGHLSRRLAAITERAARLARASAGQRLQLIAEVDRQLQSLGHPLPRAGEWLELAQAGLRRCDTLLAARNFTAAYLEADRAMRPARMVERGHWDAAVADLPSPITSPLAASFVTLPYEVTFAGRLAQSQFVGTDALGGEFESVAALEQTGWRHQRYTEPGVRSDAEISPETPHFGRGSLRLRARPADAAQPPGLVESPPIWVTSPETYVAAGELVRISGWVRVPVEPTGSVDGVLVFDSLGGAELAARLHQANEWQRLVLYRVAPRAGNVRVTIALTGMGEAWVDDFAIDRLRSSRDAAPQPPAGAPEPVPAGPVARVPAGS